MYGAGLEMAANVERNPPEFQLIVERLQKELGQYNELVCMIEQKANNLACMPGVPEKESVPSPRPSGVIGVLYEATDSLSVLNTKMNRIYKHLDQLV